MRARCRRDEAGVTLVELVVTIFILAVALVALLEGMRTSIFASDEHRKQAVAETAIRRFAESVKAANPADACDAGVTTTTTPVFTQQVKAVKGWDEANHTFVACAAGARVTLISLEVSSKDGRVVEALDVVRRKR